MPNNNEGGGFDEGPYRNIHTEDANLERIKKQIEAEGKHPIQVPENSASDKTKLAFSEQYEFKELFKNNDPENIVLYNKEGIFRYNRRTAWSVLFVEHTYYFHYTNKSGIEIIIETDTDRSDAKIFIE